MAKRAVVLGFETRNLDKAESAARKVLATVKQTQGVARDVVRDIRGQARDALKEMRALKSGAIERDRLATRAGALKGRSAGTFFAEAQAGFDRVGRFQAGASAVQATVDGLRSNKLSENTEALSNISGQAGGTIGKVAQIVLKVAAAWLRHEEDKLDKKLAAALAYNQAELHRLRYELDYSRKLQEDPAFANAEARKAYDIVMAEERAMAEGGWHEASDFMESFGG